MNRVIKDPEKLIKMISRIIDLSCYAGPLPIPDKLKVTYYEFVDIANMEIEIEEQSGGNVQEGKELFLEMEEDIRNINGFSDETIPEGLIIKYK